MRKGTIVKLRKDAWDNYGIRPPTQEELEAWYASDDSKGMDSAGETKLPPLTVYILVKPSDELRVLRARARAPVGWGRPRPGMMKVARVGEPTGLPFYVRQECFEEVPS